MRVNGTGVCGRMQIRMRNSESLTPQQTSDFLKASEEVVFNGANQAEVYAWVERVLLPWRAPDGKVEDQN